ncbi:MAG: glycoside hydrolase family 125 protein [archaeon]|nr:glycoside hydrolase family 125 protein [archaeon]
MDKSNAFHSEVIEKYVEEMCSKIKNKDVATIFKNCYTNTLDTTVSYDPDNKDTFIITGDINAMWLRDSSFQVYPYIKHCPKDPTLNDMILCLFNRQIKSILIDPYANAFNKTTYDSPWQSDITYKREGGKRVPAMNTKLWERKFELDSLICPLFLMNYYYSISKNIDFINNDFFTALLSIIQVVEGEQRGTDDEDLEGGENYYFQRRGEEPFDSQHQGRGNPAKTCGLAKCNFRNSDDATLYPFNIPENAFISSVFEKISKLIYDNKEEIIKKCSSMTETKINSVCSKLNNISKTISDAIYKYAIMTDPETKEEFFAYEVDGFGNQTFMEDPGYPSLMSLPFLGFVSENDQRYLNTRKKILSERNPYFIQGKCGKGVASSHSYRRYIWPLFTLMQGITTTSEEEAKECLALLVKSAEGTGYMHESFDVDDPSRYTRSWFAWANSFFGVFIETLMEKFPDIKVKFSSDPKCNVF